MLRLIGLALSIGIADSLNPTTIAPALYLATGKHARKKVAQFTAGVFLVYLVGGAVIALGPGRLIVSIFPRPTHHTRSIIETVAGSAMLIAGAYVWRRRKQLAERDLPSVNPDGKSSAILGATITAIELPTAFPYFAVIAAIVGADLDVPRQLLLLVLFNLCFIGPLLTILGVLTLAPGQAQRVLGAARDWVQDHWPQALSILLAIAGVFVILLGVTGLWGRRSRFGRFVHRLPRFLH
jgi:cytochrome c biogenesis protein CcdA